MTVVCPRDQADRLIKLTAVKTYRQLVGDEVYDFLSPPDKPIVADWKFFIITAVGCGLSALLAAMSVVKNEEIFISWLLFIVTIIVLTVSGYRVQWGIDTYRFRLDQFVGLQKMWDSAYYCTRHKLVVFEDGKLQLTPEEFYGLMRSIG